MNPKQQPSVATAARRRTASAAPSPDQRLARENADLRERLAKAQAQLQRQADTSNPAQPVPEPSPGSDTPTNADAVNEPQAQNVDVLNPGGVLADPQDAPGSVTTPGDEMVDPILAGTNDTADVEVPVAGTTQLDPNAVIDVQPDHRAETFGENAFQGDHLNPGPDTIPDISGDAARSAQRRGNQRQEMDRSDRARLGRMVNASRDRIWASLRLARLRMQAGLVQGTQDDLDVARQIEASDASMDVIQNEITTLSAVAQRTPAPEQPRRTARRQQQRTPSLAAGSAPQIGVLGSRDTGDEFLFD